MSGRAEASGRPARLLLADSDPSLRTVLQLALQAHGYQVALADSADTALELAGHEHSDLIVLDVGLPGVADVIRALRQASTTPILLLTWPTEPDPQAALDIGADDALTKPFGIGQLLQRLQTLRTLRPGRPAKTTSKQWQQTQHGCEAHPADQQCRQAAQPSACSGAARLANPMWLMLGRTHS
jgi:DNA-binding response OmpR family regulator